MTDEEKKELLNKVKVIAVVGISQNLNKPSNIVARYLKQEGYTIIPVNPNYNEVLGEKCYRSLVDIKERIDIVDIFMRSEKLMPIVEEAVKIKPQCIWLQLGIINESVKRLAEENNIKFVMDQCIKIEHTRLIKGFM
ncbi:MAG TPA: CoA-binding protein [Syntrophorhabdaceae bacterium]|nr:CoA-binding protein [Syntrophorhabdaceae bacterium]